MSAGEQGINTEGRTILLRDLNSLSGKYGKIERNPNGTVLSNDEGFTEVFSGIKELLAAKHGGIGIFIGSGGHLSLLPDLPIDIALVLDINSAVLEFNEVLTRLVEQSPSPEVVFQQLSDPGFKKQKLILDDIDKIYGFDDMAINFLKKEQRVYGNYHWSHPTRFNRVKEALRKKPVVYVAADIRYKNFGTALSGLLTQNGESIRFANFTNVHSWLKPKSMDFLLRWPIEQDAVMLFSSHKDGLVGDWPKMYLANGCADYIQQTTAEV